MNEEIKSLLGYLHFNVYETTNWVTPLALDDKTWKLLLNYITNLQEENCNLKETNEEHRKINGQLQEENKFLKDYKDAYGSVLIANKMLEEENQKLVKVIEELEKYICSEWYCFDNESIEFEVAKNILNKLTELKERK